MLRVLDRRRRSFLHEILDQNYDRSVDSFRQGHDRQAAQTLQRTLARMREWVDENSEQVVPLEDDCVKEGASPCLSSSFVNHEEVRTNHNRCIRATFSAMQEGEPTLSSQARNHQSGLLVHAESGDTWVCQPMDLINLLEADQRQGEDLQEALEDHSSQFLISDTDLYVLTASMLLHLGLCYYHGDEVANRARVQRAMQVYQLAHQTIRMIMMTINLPRAANQQQEEGEASLPETPQANQRDEDVYVLAFAIANNLCASYAALGDYRALEETMQFMTSTTTTMQRQLIPAFWQSNVTGWKVLCEQQRETEHNIFSMFNRHSPAA